MSFIRRRLKQLEQAGTPESPFTSAHLVLVKPGDDPEAETKRQAPDYRDGDELIVIRFVRAEDKSQAVH